MTLLITVFAAVIATTVWYKGMPKNELRTGILCWLYWGCIHHVVRGCCL